MLSLCAFNIWNQKHFSMLGGNAVYLFMLHWILSYCLYIIRHLRPLGLELEIQTCFYSLKSYCISCIYMAVTNYVMELASRREGIFRTTVQGDINPSRWSRHSRWKDGVAQRVLAGFWSLPYLPSDPEPEARSSWGYNHQILTHGHQWPTSSSHFLQPQSSTMS